MNTIKKYAWFLELFCFIFLLPFIAIISFLKVVGTFSEFGFCKQLYPYVSALCQIRIPSSASFLSRIFIIGFDSVYLFLALFGVFYFIKVLHYYKHGQVFTLEIFRLFRRISWIALIWAIYGPIKSIVMSLLLTFYNPPGSRIVALTVSSNDIINIFIVGFFFVITSLMYEGYKLKNEQDLTV